MLISHNPVAAAHFFDIIVKASIKHVLSMGTDHPGLYGDTAGYYGTVEQPGHLTLHLHMLPWISGALFPQDIPFLLSCSSLDALTYHLSLPTESHR